MAGECIRTSYFGIVNGGKCFLGMRKILEVEARRNVGLDLEIDVELELSYAFLLVKSLRVKSTNDQNRNSAKDRHACRDTIYIVNISYGIYYSRSC